MLARGKTWKHTFNTNRELSQNRTEKQIMLFKTTVNCLFNDIWCYLVIGCFDWKICVFQQTCKGFIVSLKDIWLQGSDKTKYIFKPFVPNPSITKEV